MKTIARFFLSMDQRIYDIVGIVLIGLAANIIVGSAGRDDEWWLLSFGMACAFSGRIAMFLRSRRAAIETSADAKRLLNKQAVSTKAALIAMEKEVPKDVESRASAAANTRKEDIRTEIERALAMNPDVVKVIVAFIVCVGLAGTGIGGTMARLYVPPNANIEATIASSMRANKAVVDDIRLLSEEVASVSALLSKHFTNTADSIRAGRIENSKAIKALRTEIITLSASIGSLSHEVASPPPTTGGHNNEDDRKHE